MSEGRTIGPPALAASDARLHPRRAWLRARSAVAALVLVLLVLIGETGDVLAHASLVKASPARRGTLSQPPSRVELTFSERLEPAYASVSVWDAAGRQVDLSDAAVAREDTRRLAVSLPPLGAGTYTVRFRVLSVDGHVVESSFPFTVRPAVGR
jgi:methionine-rich copper-binding protein CopC